MPIAGVVTCAHCHAVVNIAWQTCLACSHPLEIKASPITEDFHSGEDTSRASGGTELTPFKIDDTVRYRTPVIKTPTNYSWAWQHGIVKEISEQFEMVIIIPSDTPQKLISIPFVYVRAYEKNEINELMEVGEHDQEGS
jgi:hypothetical protein